MKESNFEELKTVLDEINSFLKQNGAVCLVEGKRDVQSLQFMGIKGRIITTSGKSLQEIAELLEEKFNTVLILTDIDRRGRSLRRRLIGLLPKKFLVEPTLRRKLFRISNKKGVPRISEVEELSSLYQAMEREIEKKEQ